MAKKDNTDALQKMLVSGKNAAVKPAGGAVQRQAEVAVTKEKELNDFVNLTFRVPEDFKRRFKVAALNANMTQTEFLQKIFNEISH